MLPLTIMATAFLVLAPVFWMVTELPSGEKIPRGYENAALYQHTYPASEYGFTRLREGALPLWAPVQECGYPFLSDPRTGIFQPLNFPFLLAPAERALALQAFLCLFLAAAGFSVFARSLGMGYIPAFLGALVFAFSGANAATMSQPALAATFAWMPLIFWAVREHIRTNRPVARLVGAVAVGGLCLAGAWGAATIVLLQVLIYAATMLVLAARRKGVETFSLATGTLLILAAGLLIAAVQIVPTLRWAVTLQDPLAFLLGTDGARHAPTGLRELAAQLFGARAPSPLRDALPGMLTPAPAYVGMLPLLVLPAAWFHREARPERLFCTLFLLLVVIAHILDPLRTDNSAFLSMLYLPAAFCLATLCALGCDRLLETGRDPRSPLIWIPVLLVTLMACVGLYASPTVSRGLILLHLLVIFPFVIMRLRWLAVPTGLALAVLVFVDLATANANYYQHPYEDAPASFERNEDLLARAGEQALGDRIFMRVHPLNAHMTGNAGFLTGLNIANGAMLPRTRKAARWWAAARGNPDLMRLAAVRVQIQTQNDLRAEDVAVTPAAATPEKHAPGEERRLVYEDGRARILVDDDALRRAVWIPNYEVADNFDVALTRLQGTGFDPHQTCILEATGRARDALEKRVPRAPDTTMLSANATCAITQDEPEHVRLRVRADAPGICLLNDTFAPGWTARVDGRRATILPANGLFRAVALDAGEHTVDYYYRPWSIWIGLVLSVASLISMLVHTLWRTIRPADRA